MAAPMTADQFLNALHAEGIDTAIPYSGWSTYGRDEATGKAFGPVHGVVIHHTGGTNSLAVVHDGRSDLPGPLCHAHLPKTGVLNLISIHRANHAGTFAQNAYDAMLAESSTHPYPDAAEPVDANDSTYGLEIENLGNGTDPYPEVQYRTAVRFAAAVCRFHGWSADSVIGHKEGTRRKVDPSFSMGMFRTDVQNALDLPAGQWGTQEENVALTEAEIAAVADAVWAKKTTSPEDSAETSTTAVQLKNLGIKANREEGKVDALAAAVAALSSQAASLEASVAALSVAGVDLDALAAKVADLLAARLQS